MVPTVTRGGRRICGIESLNLPKVTTVVADLRLSWPEISLNWLTVSCDFRKNLLISSKGNECNDSEQTSSGKLMQINYYFVNSHTGPQSIYSQRSRSSADPLQCWNASITLLKLLLGACPNWLIHDMWVRPLGNAEETRQPPTSYWNFCWPRTFFHWSSGKLRATHWQASNICKVLWYTFNYTLSTTLNGLNIYVDPFVN